MTGKLTTVCCQFDKFQFALYQKQSLLIVVCEGITITLSLESQWKKNCSYSELISWQRTANKHKFSSHAFMPFITWAAWWRIDPKGFFFFAVRASQWIMQWAHFASGAACWTHPICDCAPLVPAQVSIFPCVSHQRPPHQLCGFEENNKTDLSPDLWELLHQLATWLAQQRVVSFNCNA